MLFVRFIFPQVEKNYVLCGFNLSGKVIV